MKQTEYLNLKNKIKKINDPSAKAVLLEFLEMMKEMDMRMNRNCLSQVPEAWKEKEEESKNGICTKETNG